MTSIVGCLSYGQAILSQLQNRQVSLATRHMEQACNSQPACILSEPHTL